MEQKVNIYLEDLKTEVKSFKEAQLSKLEQQEKRLKKIEDSYFLSKNRPMVGTEESLEYKKQLLDYLKKGIRNDNDTEGFPLRYDVINSLDKYLYQASPMRRIASVDRISGDYATYVISKNCIVADWVSVKPVSQDNEFLSEDTVMHNIYTHELYIQPKVTTHTLDDSMIDIEKWIIDYAGMAFIKSENESFINGNGQGMPIGILSHNNLTSATKKISTNFTTEIGKISFDDIIKLLYQLPDEMRNEAAFLMHPSVLENIRNLKYPQSGQYIWQPSSKVGDLDTIMGIPVATTSNMPSFEPGNIIIALGNFKRGYKIVEKSDVRILRDPFSAKPYVSFYITKKVGANIIDPKALMLLTLKNK